MGISRAMVEHVSRLARLRLDADEVDTMTQQLDAIVGHIDELMTVDVSGVEPFTHAADVRSTLRSDTRAPDALHAAPARFGTAVHDGYFTVPQLTAQRSTGRTDETA